MTAARTGKVAAVAVMWVSLGTGAAYGQTNERLYANLDFRFSTPGARAVGMGRSFIGLADDATAADVNPAGIVNLRETEVAMSYTVTAYRREYFATPPLTSTTIVQAPSFFSLVVPVNSWRFAVFQNTTQRYRDSFCVDQLGGAATGNMSIDITNFGGSVAFEAHPKVSIGGSISASSLDFAAQGRSVPGRECADRPLTPKNGTDTYDSSTRPKAVVGIQLWPTERLAIGAAFHSRVTYPMDTTLFGSFAQRGRGDVPATGEVRRTDYVLPTRVGAGVGFVAGERLVAVADWQYIRYSEQVTDNFQVIDFQDAYTKEYFFARDAHELHAGLEWRAVRPGRVLSWRAGVFTDPDHAIRFQPFQPGDHRLISERFNSTRPDTDVGVSAGVGGAWAGRVQVDVGASFVRDAFDMVVSAVLRMP